MLDYKKINNSIQELNFKESKHKFLVETEKEKDGYQKSVKALLQECEKTKELGETIRLDLYRLGSPDRYELDGIQFYLGEDEELENGIQICIDEEFLPDWQEQNEEITGYSLQYFELDEETGDGYVDIVLE